MCKKCGANFNIFTLPPQKEGICDKCGGELYQRDDDKEEVIAKRLTVYKNQTEPLIEYYKKRGILKNIDASTGSIDEIVEKIKEVLK